MENKDYIAACDLGSNSFRLLICRNQKGHLQLVDSLKEMIHFARGLDKNNYLNLESRRRALKILKEFGERLRGFHPNQVRIVATNTFRVAKNINEFLPAAEAALGFPIEIIGGTEEARLIYTGVMHTLPPEHKKILLVDIGGGSTEFAVGIGLQPELTESLNLGCVTYSQNFFTKNDISAKMFDDAVNAARATLSRINKNIQKTKWKTAIGSSGTAKAIADLSFKRYPRQNYFTYSFLEELKEEIIAAGSVQKAKLKGLKNNRVQVFPGGLAIMLAVFEELQIKEMTGTEAGLRDGVLYDFIGRALHQDLRDETVNACQINYQVNLKQARRVEHIALLLFDLLAQDNLSAEERLTWRHYLIWAAKLHEIGLSLSHSGYHKHSAYIIENSDMPGFSRTDQQIVALMVLSHRHDLKNVVNLLTKKELWYAVIALRLAAIFCRGRNNLTLPGHVKVSFDAKKKVVKLSLASAWLEQNPLITSMLKKEKGYWQSIDYDFIVNLEA